MKKWFMVLGLAALLTVTLDKGLGLLLSALPNGQSSGAGMLAAMAVPFVMVALATALIDGRKTPEPVKIRVKND